MTVTALDTAKQPYAGKSCATRYGRQPAIGLGQPQLRRPGADHYIGTNAGLDTIQMYVDLGGTGSQTAE